MERRGREAGQPGKERRNKEREGVKRFFFPQQQQKHGGRAEFLENCRAKKSRCLRESERGRENQERGRERGLGPERKKKKSRLFFFPTNSSKKNLKPSTFSFFQPSTAPPRIPLQDGFRSQGPRHGRQRPRQPPFGESIMRAEREGVGERRENWREKRIRFVDDGDLDASACDLLRSFSCLSVYAESKPTSILNSLSKEQGQFGRNRARARREFARKELLLCSCETSQNVERALALLTLRSRLATPRILSTALLFRRRARSH